MKVVGRYASTTTKVRFEDEYIEELLYDELQEEAFEYVDITEVVYLYGMRFIIEDKVSYENGFTIFATRYEKHGAIKKELQLITDWGAKEYTYSLIEYDMR